MQSGPQRAICGHLISHTLDNLKPNLARHTSIHACGGARLLRHSHTRADTHTHINDQATINDVETKSISSKYELKQKRLGINTHQSSIREDSLTWSLKQPLIPSNPFGATFLHRVQYSTKPQCCVSWHHLQLSDHLLQNLPWVEGEGVLGKTDLLVCMT